MIRGFCLGGGVAIALHADLRIASEAAEFGIPAGRLGIAYPFRAVRKLVDAVGAANAKEILFTADRFDAAVALRMGLVNRVEADAELDRMVRQIASRIGECAPLSVCAAKAMVEQALKDVDVRDVALCDTLFNRCLASEDYQEGRRAFREKRRPIFVGR
jgi:enoyl-CoA hydratase/carnithine racemase